MIVTVRCGPSPSRTFCVQGRGEASAPAELHLLGDLDLEAQRAAASVQETPTDEVHAGTENG